MLQSYQLLNSDQTVTLAPAGYFESRMRKVILEMRLIIEYHCLLHGFIILTVHKYLPDEQLFIRLLL
jgi:hypothetical protein